VEKTHRILHVPTFKSELASFWKRPSAADESWLAQFFVILALGCQAHNYPVHVAQGQDYAELTTQLLDASELLLKRTPFLFRPNLANIRTLCLMVIAKQTGAASCYESDASWPLIGLVVRLAMGMGLHSEAAIQNHKSALEIESRRALWTTVMYMEVRQSMTSGMPLLLCQEDFTCLAPSNVNDDETHSLFDGPVPEHDLSEKTDSSMQVIIYHAFPTLAKVVKYAQSETMPFNYDHAMLYNMQIRQLMKYSRTLLLGKNNNPTTTTSSSSSSPDLQWVTLDIVFRRALLLLHRRFAHQPSASTQYSLSYWTSLECSLALLAHQRELADSRNRWFAGLFRQDFVTAAVTVCLHLVQTSSSLEPPLRCPCAAGSGSGHDTSSTGARNIVPETLRSCREIWEVERHLTVCQYQSFRFLNEIVEALERDFSDCSE